MTKGIDDDDEGEPQGRKGVRLETRQPFETRPGHHPGQNSDDQAEPPHQGNDRAGRLSGSTFQCCLKALIISAVRQVQMINV